MFNNMKNKIREKTGAELPKFSTSSSLFGKSRSNQHSRQNSQSSINSFLSDQSNKDESDMKPSSTASKNTILDTPKVIEENSATSEMDWEHKLAEKEREWREKEKTYVSDLLKQTKELQEALTLVEESKKKYQCCQEEKEQLELYQKQEISKIKQLLLVKEEENNTNAVLLKETQSLVESLRHEINRLKPLEEQINNCQINRTSMSFIASQEEGGEESNKLKLLMSRLEMLSKENEALRQSNEESRNILDESLSKEIAKNNKLNVEIIKLKDYSQELAAALEDEKKVKDETLLRNAEISQLVQLSEQDLKEQQTQSEEFIRKIAALESQLETSEQRLQTLQFVQKSENGNDEDEFKEKIKELENEISEKNKSIRILQQNLYDVKKTLQTELKNNVETTSKPSSNNPPSLHFTDEDINFKYMKHVLIKFLTSSEYEAQQLTKAVATLLKLNSDEERLIKETLEWRSSWFRPKLRVKLPFTPS